MCSWTTVGLQCKPHSRSLSYGLWILDLGLEFGTWIWDLDLGLGFGTSDLDLGLTIVRQLLQAFSPLSLTRTRMSPILSNSVMHII